MPKGSQRALLIFENSDKLCLSYAIEKQREIKRKNVQQILTDEEHMYVSFFSQILNFKSSVSLFFRIFLKNFIYQADGGISGEEVYSGGKRHDIPRC